MRLTPSIPSKGRYTLKDPFVAVPTVAYSTIALRKFQDIEEEGINVFAEYYEPMGLTEAVYLSDAREGALIVTLVDDVGNFIYVPDTYILSFPNMGDVKYQHVVLSISLGALPEYVPLDALKQTLSGLTSDMIGVSNVVSEHIAPSRGVVTPENHELMEIARTAAISMRTSERAEYLKEKQKRIALEEQVTLLMQILRDNGLLPP